MSDERSRDLQPGGEPVGAEVTARFVVPAMDCPSCAQKVDNRLQRLTGVVATALAPTTGTVTVSFDPSQTSEESVVHAIESAGYDVAARADDADVERGSGPDIAPPARVWRSSRAVKTWIGAGFLTLGLLVEFLFPAGNGTVATVLRSPIRVSDVLLLAAIVASGAPVIRSGYYSARARSLDIDLLMGTAIIAATGIGYFVEAATLAVLFSVAELLEQYSMDRARDSLRELMTLSPDEATVVREGEEVTVSADAVEIGERVVIRPGEKIPLDGTVIEGASAVDESPITGESVPVDKSAGDAVYAGSLNHEGYLRIRVTSVASASTLSRIIELVEGAQADRTETEQFVDRFAGYYTPFVVGLAILVATLPPLLIAEPFAVTVSGYSLPFTGAWQPWFIRGLTLLVIACPCAFVISTPVSVVSGVTSAARNGVLIKGGRHLEAMGEVEVIALDKTGTLTSGALAVTDVVPIEAEDANEVLGIAAALERRSEHPLAEAIVRYAQEQGVEAIGEPTEFESLTGRGVRGSLDGDSYRIGKPALFEDLGLDRAAPEADSNGGLVASSIGQGAAVSAELEDRIAALERDGKTVILVGGESELLGLVAIADEVRPTARETVDRLHAHGVEQVVMLTGDNERTAGAVAEEIGVDSYQAALLPEDKVRAIQSLQERYGRVAMVGDGINDAPALATADVGVVMGAAGSDTALETADIALMADDLSKLPYLYTLSHRANAVIRENIWTSLGVKFLLALGVPFGLVSVALAVVVGDMGMSLGVTGNAMRLARVTPE